MQIEFFSQGFNISVFVFLLVLLFLLSSSYLDCFAFQHFMCPMRHIHLNSTHVVGSPQQPITRLNLEFPFLCTSLHATFLVNTCSSSLATLANGKRWPLAAPPAAATTATNRRYGAAAFRCFCCHFLLVFICISL